jgi:hypothetical protein
MITGTLSGARWAAGTLCAIVALLGTSTAVRAQGYDLPGSDRWFRLEWQAGQSAKRGPVVSGYVHELAGRTADSMQLGIDRLDAAGAVTGTQIAYVTGTVPPGGRAYFEVPVPAAPAYRVRIVWYRWLGIGGGP